MSPSQCHYDVVIVGSGFAGLAAANLLGGSKLRVLLVDENRHLGGQMLRRMPPKSTSSGKFGSDRLKRIGFDLVNAVRQNRVHVLKRAEVLGVDSEKVLCLQDGRGRVWEVRAEFIILATGARERFLPFKGWTLPGVMSTGAAQILMKSSGILPAREILIGGSGPLPLVLANELLNHGGRVLGVVVEPFLMAQLPFLKFWRRQTGKLLEGTHALARLLFSRIPVKPGTRIMEARGNAELEEIVTIGLDQQGRGIPGTETRIRTECLAVGHGFTPNLELPQLAGCHLEFRADRGGWIVSVDNHLATSIANVYAAGEVTGIAGAEKSFIEGQMAALDILRKCGLNGKQNLVDQWTVLHRERQNQLKFGRLLNALWRIPSSSYEIIPDETVICRCEEVTMGEIRRQLQNGHATPGALKRATRSGMGYCQGRMCGPTLYDILAARSGNLPGDVPPLSVRVPVKPVRLEALAGLSTGS